MKLSLLEKIAIGWGIPINTIGFAFKNKKSFTETAKFYWQYKKEKYFQIIEALETGKEREAMLEKYMPLICYRGMIRVATKRTPNFTKADYSSIARQIPLDLDKSFNPRYVPKKTNQP